MLYNIYICIHSYQIDLKISILRKIIEYTRNNVIDISECGYSQKSTLIAFACLHLKRS